MIADVTGLTIDLAAGAEAGAAFGAARLAMLAAGGDEEAVCRRPPTERQFVPDTASAAIHAPRLRRFRALYAAEKATRGGGSSAI
jgi:xylulokinase